MTTTAGTATETTTVTTTTAAAPTTTGPVIADDTPTQLRLVVGGRDLVAPVDHDWVLDDRTRTIGRCGIAQIRATLRQHRPLDATDPLAC